MPGQRLVENDICKRLKIGRTPFREACRNLEIQGYLTIQPYKGAIINQISLQEIKDYYRLLILLEGKAVEWATPLLSERDIQNLSYLNESLRALPRDDSELVDNWMTMNANLHDYFRNNCGNEKMNWLINEIRSRVTRYRYSAIIITSLEDYIDDHDQIIDAVKQRDAQKARQAMKTHIKRARDILLKFLTRMPAL